MDRWKSILFLRIFALKYLSLEVLIPRLIRLSISILVNRNFPGHQSYFEVFEWWKVECSFRFDFERSVFLGKNLQKIKLNKKSANFLNNKKRFNFMKSRRLYKIKAAFLKYLTLSSYIRVFLSFLMNSEAKTVLKHKKCTPKSKTNFILCYHLLCYTDLPEVRVIRLKFMFKITTKLLLYVKFLLFQEFNRWIWDVGGESPVKSIGMCRLYNQIMEQRLSNKVKYFWSWVCIRRMPFGGKQFNLITFQL